MVNLSWFNRPYFVVEGSRVKIPAPPLEETDQHALQTGAGLRPGDET